MNKEKKSLLDKLPLLNKLKKVKGIEYIIVGIVCLLVFVIYFTTMSNGNSSNNTTKTTPTNYAEVLETKLGNVLSQVAGAGKVSVMVTLENSGEIIIATSTEEKTNISSGSSNSTQSNTKVEAPVIVDDQPLIVMEYYPKIKGVLVVAQGASSVKVRLELLKAVQTVVDVDANQIEILVGE